MADEMIQGLKYFMMASGAQKGIIGIEDNKPDAIALVKEKVASEPNIEVCVCAEKYPEGSEKHLIYAATGRTVPDRGLPADVGVIVDNVGTAVACYRMVKRTFLYMNASRPSAVTASINRATTSAAWARSTAMPWNWLPADSKALRASSFPAG